MTDSLATGSRPYIPRISGDRCKRCFALRTLADARAMAQKAQSTDHAVMLGGGLLNLKAAFALLEIGVEGQHWWSTLLRSFSQAYGTRDAGLVRKALDNAGLKIITGRSAKGILSKNNSVTGVSLDDGSELVCQMVCIGKGVEAEH